VVRIAVTDRYHIGQDFFRWELATAVAGAVLGINPFDQPDVEASKEKTRELTIAHEKSGALPAETALLEEAGLTLFADERNSKRFGKAGTLVEYLRAHLGHIREGVTSARENGADMFKVMDVTRHRRVETLKGYDRRAKAFRNHAGDGFL
jgi:hypothetical protein